jgi:phage shock protein PspC (stress-responsive transcriptional regulator)
MNKTLYRSKENRILAGICGGIAEKYDANPTTVRIITVLLFFLPGIGILTYLILWIFIPEKPA